VTLRRILLPTDFSDCADRALPYAVDVANRFEATLHLFHVVNELRPDRYEGDADRDEDGQEALRAEVEARLGALVEEDMGLGVDVESIVEPGLDVGDAVTAYAQERNVDLVVMGTQGRRGVGRLLLGNIADTVVREAPCPVMSVRKGIDLPNEKAPLFRRVLAPIDFSDASRRALAFAKQFAAAYDARLDLLFVGERRMVPTFSDTGLPGVSVVDMDPEIIENAEAALHQLDDRVGPSPEAVHYHVRTGQASEEIVGFAQEEQIDLVVMAKRGLDGMDRFLIGSTTERVARSAPCPVLTLSSKGMSASN